MDTQQQVAATPVWVYEKPSANPVIMAAIAEVRIARGNSLLQTVPEATIENALVGNKAAYAIVLSTYVGNVMRTEVGQGVSVTALTRERLRVMFRNDEEHNEAVRLLELVLWIKRRERPTNDQDSLAGYMESNTRERGE